MPAPDSWSQLKKSLRHWDAPRLLGLIHDLYTTVPEARAAIAGRLTLDKPAAANAASLDALRKQVRTAVRPSHSMRTGEPNMRAARRIGDQYLRASSDADGAIILYVEMLDAAIGLVVDFGRDGRDFYNSLDSVANAAAELAPIACDAASLTQLIARLRVLMSHRSLPGSMEDFLDQLIGAFEDRTAHLAQTDSDRVSPPS